jgi:antitoxin (DNA-binding transcriptional repressor) of toxin-antitoxin stability system
MTRTSSLVLAFALTLVAVTSAAAPAVRELIPAEAPGGARLLIAGSGLGDETITIAFPTLSGSKSAAVLRRESAFIEIEVPFDAASGTVRIARDGTTLAELPFVLAAAPGYARLTTIAGGPQTGDSIFKEPYSATIDPESGTLYVADTSNHRIRSLASDGTATTIAGTTSSGFADGTGSGARFKEPHAIAWHPLDRVLYVADTGNHSVRRVTPEGVVTTIAGTTSSGFTDGTGTAARFKEPRGIAVDSAGILYVSDTANHVIRRVTPSGTVTTFAGNGIQGSTNGAASSARFNKPEGLDVAGDTIYVADTDNHVIRAITNDVVSTVAGLAGNSNSTDGSPTAARFKEPSAVASDGLGGLIVADTENHIIRRIDLAAGTVTRIAGTTQGDYLDGAALSAKFKEPTGVVFAGAAFITDSKNYAIRALCPEVRLTGLFVPGGSTSAGTEVRLFGTGFVSGATSVTFDDVAAGSVRWISSTAIAATLPEALTAGSVTVVVTACGGSTPAQTFIIDGTPADTTPPQIAIVSPANGQLVGSATVTVSGTADDATSITVNGVGAVIEPASQTFSATIPLLEGRNVITARGTDAAGNSGFASIELILDTRAPVLTVAEVAPCTRGTSVELRGTVTDPHLDKVIARLGTAYIDATVTGANWSALIPLGDEGRKTILIEAIDALGHTATRQVALAVDRTAPVIEISESGAPFTVTVSGRPVAPLIRATDADANPNVAMTLDGNAYVSGTEIGQEGQHTIRVVASDCAGNESSREHAFTIDLTPPRFLTFTPESGARVAQIPASLSGTADPDAIEVRVVGTEVTAPVTNGQFTIANIAFAEGTNERTLELIDRAGHTAQMSYTLTARTAQPVIEITESGEPLVDGTIFNRIVTPRMRADGEGISVTATLNGAPFTSGSAVTADGQYTLSATATDSIYGHSAQATRQFGIDRTPPVVQILAPLDGTTVDADRIDVRATGGDAVSVTANGVAAVRSGSEWVASVALDQGENAIVVVARDAAGNSGSAAVHVTRGLPGPAIVLTFPPDPFFTNRRTLDVSGRVLHTDASVTVTLPPAAPLQAPVDPAGVFRLPSLALTEGESLLTASATRGGKTTSFTASVTADFTPPRVRILAGGEPLPDGAQFATEAVIAGEATDGGEAIDFVLTIDGVAVTQSPMTITADGGHTATITARDLAGNEARVERTFFIGSSGGGGCALESFDPADQSVIGSQSVQLAGRSGGAAGVKVNGIAALISSGSFSATVELPQEGANVVSIQCTDAAGTAIGTPATITLYRATNDPSISITAPAEDSVTADETITVTGTVSSPPTGLSIRVDVNGKPASLTGATWSASGVRLLGGVNVLVATARLDGGRAASASRRITWIKDAPSISISSPIAGAISGTATIDVSGTWRNLDPASIAVTGTSGAVDSLSWSDTTGRFVASHVPLQSGENTIEVTGRDRTGRLARATIAVRYLSPAPTVTIADPADNHYFPASQGTSFRVSGTFAAAAGSSIDVNGLAATIDGHSFFADVPFSNLPGGITPVVARLTQSGDGEGAFDSLRVYQLEAPPRVIETFPAPDAVEVPSGTAVLVLFSAPMDRASLSDGFRLETASGVAVSGKSYLDHDVLTFAPATLTPGERYTIRVNSSARDLAGQPLSSAVAHSFTVGSTAPTAAPVLTTPSGSFCGQIVDVTGTSIPGARVRIDYGSIVLTTTAGTDGVFTYRVPLSGQQGFHIIRVRTLGGDGTLSAAAELRLDVDCAGPRVVHSTFDRTTNRLTIRFSRAIRPPLASAFTLRLTDGRAVAATLGTTAVPEEVLLIPSEDLTAETFTLTVDTTIEDLDGRRLAFAHTQLFSLSGDDELQPGDGQALIAGEVYDSLTGRPLPGAAVTIGTLTLTTDLRGRYAARVEEGAHTVRASLDGYTTVTRQVIVAAGTAQIPIDIRLEKKR